MTEGKEKPSRIATATDFDRSTRQTNDNATSDPGRAPDQTHNQQDQPKVSNLNRTQRDVLWTLLGGERNGMTITGMLTEYYGEEINTGRVYPAADDLVAEGFIEKDTSPSGPQNRYRITEDGRRALTRRRMWQDDMQSDQGGGSE